MPFKGGVNLQWLLDHRELNPHITVYLTENLSTVDAPRQTQIMVTIPAIRSGDGERATSVEELKIRVRNIISEPTIAMSLLLLGLSFSSVSTFFSHSILSPIGI
jgi:hypothetical protein